MIDNATLLIGIAFSGASLMIALVIGWMNARSETYLVHGAAGIALIVLALTGLGLRNGRYDLLNQLIPFTVMLAGFAFVLSGSRLFNQRAPGPALVPAVASIVATAIPLLLGLSGVGTIMLNAGGALFVALCGL